MSSLLLNLALFGPFVGLLLASTAPIVAVALRRAWLTIPLYREELYTSSPTWRR